MNQNKDKIRRLADWTGGVFPIFAGVYKGHPMDAGIIRVVLLANSRAAET